MRRGVATRGVLFGVATLAFAALVSRQELWEAALAAAFGPSRGGAFPAATIGQLVIRHLSLVALSSALTVAVAVPLGIFVTRPGGSDFRELAASVADLGQTFPPIAVLALMMPLLGLGAAPAIVALFLYGLFPVLSNTVAGLDSVPPAVLDAARGMGLGRWRILATIELPLASRVIMAGVRTSVVVNIGTATVAAATGAGGLGSPIFSGIALQNGAYVLEGAVAAALLALLADAGLATLEEALAPRAA